MSKDLETAKICLLECIKGNLTGKSVQNPEDDKEEIITQVLCNVFNKKGKNLFIEWSVKYADRSLENAVDLWSLYTPDKTKDRVTLDTLIELARPYDTENKLPEDLYAIWKINHETTCFKVMERFYLIENNTINSYNLHDIKVIFMHDEDNMKKWLTDKNIKKYTDIDFLPPPMECKPTTFNLWNLKQNFDSEINNEVSTEIFHEFFKYLCLKDENVYDYFIKYLAHLLKYPGIKPEVCLFFTSSQGSGRDTLLKIMQLLMGENFVLCENDPDNVFGKYNWRRMNKLVVCLQETDNIKSYAGKIKDIVTCKTATLADKGVKSVQVRDYTRLIIFSNKQNIVNIEPDDRRFVVIQPWNFHINPNPEFFTKLHEAINNTDMINKLRHELTSYNIQKDFNFQQYRPMTEIYKDLKEVNTPSIIQWAWVLAEVKDEGYISSTDLCMNYNSWCKQIFPDARDVNVKSFGLNLKKYFCINGVWIGFESKRTMTGATYKIKHEALKSVIENKYGYIGEI